jgi:hypothetical protein
MGKVQFFPGPDYTQRLYLRGITGTFKITLRRMARFGLEGKYYFMIDCYLDSVFQVLLTSLSQHCTSKQIKDKNVIMLSFHPTQKSLCMFPLAKGY